MRADACGARSTAEVSRISRPWTLCQHRAAANAAPALGLPADHALVATIFLGVPTHQNTKLRRNPVNSFATIDRFDGDSFG